MQKWYDEGYFTSNLLMKRTHLDTDWTPVGELSVRAGNEKLFFSSFSEPGPPGLAHPSIPPNVGQTFDRTGHPVGQVPHQHPHHSSEPFPNGSPLNHFRNPVTTRSSTLDSLLGSSSNQSHSPTSSFGAAGLVPAATDSPDLPFVSGARASFGNNVTEPTFGGHVSAFEQHSPSIAHRSGTVGFGATTEPHYGHRLASLGQRGSMFEAQSFNNLTNSVPPTSPWGAGGSNAPRNHDSDGIGSMGIQRASLGNSGFNNAPVTTIPPFGEFGGLDSTQFGSDAYISNTGFSQSSRGDLSADSLSSGFGHIGVGALRDQSLRPLHELENTAVNNQHGIDERSLTSAGFGTGFGSSATSTVSGQGAMFGMHGSRQSLPPQLSSQHLHLPPKNLHSISTFNQFPSAPAPSSPTNAIQPQQPTANIPTSQPPWGLPQPSTQSHPHPFDSPHPTPSNVTQAVVSASEIGSYNDQQLHSKLSNWYKTEHDEGLGDASGSRPPLTNQGIEASHAQETAWNITSNSSPALVGRGTDQGPTSHAQHSTPPQAPGLDSVPQTSTKKRVPPPLASQPVAPRASVVLSANPAEPDPKPPSPRPATLTQAKPAWSTPVINNDDESRATKHAGLREIHEAEAKRVEARKLAERERERAARALPQEETSTFTASWGLPTSQAGTARTTSKEQTPVAATAASAPSVVPVWSNATKPQPNKRTMKEIQEEEERRKKALAKEKETATAAARRAYADSANKV